MSKISLIIEREYLTRVQKKSFILMTILSPIVMVALIFAPIWLAQLSSDEVRQIAIIDQTGSLQEYLRKLRRIPVHLYAGNTQPGGNASRRIPTLCLRYYQR